MTLEKNKALSLNEQVYLKLYDRIISGYYQPGMSLLVLELSKELGTSQSPIREALERLKQDGLITKEANKSAIVTNVTLEEMKDIYQLRSLIEGYVVKESKSKITKQDIEFLYDLYSRMLHAAKKGDLNNMNNLDMKFHGFFYECCNNKEILKIWKRISIKILRFINNTNRLYFKTLEDVAKTHLPLIEVVESGRPEEAQELFLNHMNEVWKFIEEKLTY